MCKYLLIIVILSVAVQAIFDIHTKLCPKNEEYSECGNNGCQNTCEDLNIGMLCKPICASGCICHEEYLRNTKGICVPACKCDTCKRYEVFELRTHTECVNTCAEPNKSANCVPNRPMSGCVCIEGYLRNDEGVCIKASKCGCGGDPNAVFNECGDTSLTCANKDNPPLRPITCNPEGGCTCRSGYVKNIYGMCIPEKRCPKCGSNQVFACGSACDTTCDTLGEECPIFNVKCNEMCYCVEGYARNKKGICIPISECPPKQCKDDPNAIIDPCGDPCPITCENKDDKSPRPCPLICLVDGCKCKKGYVIGPNGKCIRRRECPAKLKCKTNEEYDPCPPSCPPEETCLVHLSGLIIDCASPPPNPDCTPSCRCKSGYLRNDNGRCVLLKNCCTDPNEELVKCPNPCSGGTCLDPTFTPCKRMCVPFGCQCKSGYVKISDTDSTCVRLSECKDCNN